MKIVAFDLDHTLFRVNCSFEFGKFLNKQKLITKWQLLKCIFFYTRHKWLDLSIYDVHHKIFDCLFKGFSQAELAKQAQLFIDLSFAKLINPNLLKKLQIAQTNKNFVLLLTSSPDFLAKIIVEKLSFDAFFATSYQIDDSGRFSKIKQIVDGFEKLTFMQKVSGEQNISSKNITFYSDNSIDLPLMNWVGEPIAVNPNRPLRKICKERGWLII